MSRLLSKLIIVLGPTASGKTELALKLAKRFNGEIVNADSRQIYRGMDIGTAKLCQSQISKLKSQNYKLKLKDKVLKEAYYGEVNGVKHWLVDITDPDKEFTVADYKKMAVAVIYDILKRGKVPFLVGGTGLYIQAVVDNLTIPSVPPNKKLRAEFESELAKAKELRIKNQESRILEKWYKKLLKLDPEATHIVDPKNPRRIIRAIEVCLATHQPFSKLREKGKPLFNVLQIGISVPREKLYERIDRRVDRMAKRGLIEETKKLLKKYDPTLSAMSGIGYSEIIEYLNQELRIKNQELRKKLLEQKIQEIKWRTHAYARRQMTWFKKDKRIRWMKNFRAIEAKIAKWLNS